MADLDQSNAHLEGHRERLRSRFLRSGEEGLSDHEVLELMLFGVIKRQDTKAIAKALLERFGGLLGVVGAPLSDIVRVKGVGEAVAIHLKAVHATMTRAAKEEASVKSVLASWSSVLGYLRIRMASSVREEFRVLYLDKRHRLIGDESMGSGTIDQAPVYPREVARRALELSASYVILTHNHPSGDPSPSQSDIVMTREIINALKPLGIGVIDHVIVGAEGSRSLKSLGLI
jgi:DNA repair protein RadC